jgi:hypothetical protein
MEDKGNLEGALELYRQALELAGADPSLRSLAREIELTVQDVEKRVAAQAPRPQPAVEIPAPPSVSPLSLGEGPELREQPRRTSPWGWVVAGLMIFALLVAIVANLQQQQAAQATATAIAQAQATATAQAQATATAIAQAQATATSQAQATATAIAQAQATATAIAQAQATATSQAIRATVSAIEANKTLVYGPSDGSLEHNAEDGLVAWNGAGVTLRNFVCEVTFYNPYSTSEGSWDYGIFFRDTGGNQQYRLAVHSDKSWDFGLRDGSNWTNTADGVISDLDISPSGQNTLRLVVKDAQAFFYVNGVYVATLDVSTKQIEGDVAVATGIWSGDEITGRTTRYTEFTVWSLP